MQIDSGNHQKNFSITLDFLEKLRNELEKITIDKLTDKEFSTILGQSEKFFTYLKKNIKRSPSFQISIQELEEIKKKIKLTFGSSSRKARSFITKYKKKKNLPLGKKKLFNFHPCFKINYFKDINSKEKAYWLGFIFADGSISYKEGGRGYKDKKYARSINLRFRFGLSPKDPDSVKAINNFTKTIGVNSKYVKIMSNGLYGVEIVNKTFSEHLINHGLIVGNQKTYNIKLPCLKSRVLYLAFLLGYFDGDGKQSTTKITSSSYELLEQIKTKFNLNARISLEKGSSAYSLHLGAELFNEMLENFHNSMVRKRIRFVTPNELIERNTKLKVTQSLLNETQRLVLYFPIKDISIYYGISAQRLGQICKENNIKLPPRGYWYRTRSLGIDQMYWEFIQSNNKNNELG